PRSHRKHAFPIDFQGIAWTGPPANAEESSRTAKSTAEDGLAQPPRSPSLSRITVSRLREESAMKTIASRLALLALLCFGQASCAHRGPSTIMADRLPYNTAIAASWQEQTLLNFVKPRYVDTPFFVEVAQIVGAYTVGEQVPPAVGVAPPFFPHAKFTDHLVANLALQKTFADRPTISYTPQTGAQFIRNLTTPIPPERILFLLQAGYPADVVLPLAVESINGVRNRSVTGAQLRQADPAFNQFVRAIRRAQISGDVGIRVEQEKG